jgi:hypothetical protein
MCYLFFLHDVGAEARRLGSTRELAPCLAPAPGRAPGLRTNVVEPPRARER